MLATTRPVDVPVSRPSFSVRNLMSAVGEVGDGSGHLGGRAAEPVQRDHDDRVAGSGVAQHGVQTRARPLGGVGQLVGEHPPRVNARSVQRRELTLEVLLDGARLWRSPACRSRIQRSHDTAAMGKRRGAIESG